MSTSDQVQDDPTPTQKIWKPVADLDKEQQRAFLELQEATYSGNTEAAQKAFQRIQEIEAEQMRAHQAARAYLLKKVQR